MAGGAEDPLPAAATSLRLNSAGAIAVNSSGELYVASGSVVLKVDRSGVATRVAGGARSGYAGDGGPATKALVSATNSLAFDRQGNLLISDSGSGRVRRVGANGVIVTLAGGGANFGAGESTLAADAISFPIGPAAVTSDKAGNIIVAGVLPAYVWQIAADGVIRRIVGGGLPNAGDEIPANRAFLGPIYAVVMDSNGNLIVGASSPTAIRKVTPDGIIHTITTGIPSLRPNGLAADAHGNFYVSDGYSNRVFRVTPEGLASAVAVGSNSPTDGAPALGLGFSPGSLAVDAQDNLFIADNGGSNQLGGRVFKITLDGQISIVAGGAQLFSSSADGGPATSAVLSLPTAAALDTEGNLVIADSLNDRIRRVSVDGVIETIAGGGAATAEGLPAASSKLNRPTGVAIDTVGNIYIAESRAGRVRRVSADGTITTVAGGSGGAGSGDGGPATQATLNPDAVTADAAGNLYIVDGSGHVIRKVTSSGTISTIAGTGVRGFSGDGGPAVRAQLWGPTSVAVDSTGAVFIADQSNRRVRKISPSGIITTVAGGGNRSEDNVPATSFSGPGFFPTGIAVDQQGSLLITSAAGVHKVLQNGNIVSIAGSGVQRYSGDGGPATQATLSGASGVVSDSRGNIYVADSLNNAVRLLRPINQAVTISAVLDAASESVTPMTPGKIVVIYGVGLGPALLVQNQPLKGVWGTEVAGTRVQLNGLAAPILYSSATAVAAIVPYGIASATSVNLTLTYQAQTAVSLPLRVESSAPSFFTLNQTGAGQIAAVNSDGRVNGALRPAKAGDYISLYATGEGQTTPAGRDGVITTGPVNPLVNLPVRVTVGGIQAAILYAGEAPSAVAGLMQVVVRVPPEVQAGGYVPVVLQVGDAATVDGAAWIAVGPS
ncbi:MAG: repeat containing protein [Bryobacterales bacterium]|nr:repeat containing protein [Bryobacterales bacterium]